MDDYHRLGPTLGPSSGVAEHLSTGFENLPLVTKFMYEKHRDIFDEIVATMRRRIPGISAVETRQTEDGRILLRFQDGSFKDPFDARFVSDGTFKMFAYLVFLHEPKPYHLLCVEEPEESARSLAYWKNSPRNFRLTRLVEGRFLSQRTRRIF